MNRWQEKISLRTRFIILMVGILAISLVLNLTWSSIRQQKQSEIEMREKAYMLSQQLDAVWEFMAINQDLINHDADGNYDFKGLHCSLVGKSIGKLFGMKTDYVIRYTNFSPRNKADEPDKFELEALNTFLNDKDATEYFDIIEYEGKESFRYMAPMKIDNTCLECHGGPVGELDILGYPKEGWKIGDLGGAVSIVMPIDLYQENFKANVIQEVAFFFILTLLFILIIYIATAKLVTSPLQRFKNTIEKIKKGELNVGFEDMDAVGEIKDLADHFSDMTVQLNNLYTNLENKVEQRTEELAKANHILELQRIQLQEANRRLREDNQYKSDFMAIMSHELRTPLTSIVAFAEIMERNQNLQSEKDMRIVKEIKANSQILLDMINNILEMARLEAGKTELLLELVDLVDVINAVDNVVQPLADRKNIRYTSTVDRDVPLIDADRERLRQIIVNLVSNAVKFTPESGEIQVRVNYDDAQKEVLINVQDNGIGIRKEHQPYIFEKFVQSDSSIYRQYNGTGLGLALAKEFTELHGGWINVVSELDKGSLFTVGIPINKGVKPMNSSMSEVHDSIAILLANRSFLYRLLQRIYGDEPNKELMEIVVNDHTEEALKLLDNDSQFSRYYDLLTQVRQDMLNDAAGTIDKLKSEYTHLMVGPATLPAPPWESVYTSKERLIFQESTLKVRQAYLKYGFLPAKYPHEADDHIALELDFMAHLAGLTAESFEDRKFEEAIKLLEDQKSFLIQHLLVWIGQFAADMQKSESQYFYPLMALLTEEVLKMDVDVVDEIIASLRA